MPEHPGVEHRHLLVAQHYITRTQLQRQHAEIMRAHAIDAPIPTPYTGVTAGGDERRLRGIPAIARGVAGAIPGTHPEKEATR